MSQTRAMQLSHVYILTPPSRMGWDDATLKFVAMYRFKVSKYIFMLMFSWSFKQVNCVFIICNSMVAVSSDWCSAKTINYSLELERSGKNTLKLGSSLCNFLVADRKNIYSSGSWQMSKMPTLSTLISGRVNKNQSNK